MASLDLDRLLRDLSSTIVDIRSFQEIQRKDSSATIVNPYERKRWVSNLSTLQQLGPDDPAAPQLASWMLWLLLGRTCFEAENAAFSAREHTLVRLASPIAEEIPIREVIHRFLRTTSRKERSLIARALEVSAGPASEAELELWMRRGEVLRRTGDVLKWNWLQPLASREELASEAVAYLAETEDLAKEVQKSPCTWEDALALGFGQQSDVPWPKKISPRWLLELFRGEAGWLDISGLQPGYFPELIGGSSVTRSFARLGARWADAAVSRELPGPLATHPAGLIRFQIGGLFASLLTHPTFLQRGFGMGRAEAARAQRQQGLVLLIATRLEAIRTLLVLSALRGDRRSTQQEAAELTRRVLGAAIPEQLALVLPRVQPTSPTRFLAAGQAASMVREIQQKYDDDWYRNPRAVIALRDQLERAPDFSRNLAQSQAGRGAIVEHITRILA